MIKYEAKDLSIKAIITGLVVDIAGTFAFYFVFVLIASLLLTATGRDIRQIEEFSKTPVFLNTSFLVGLLFTSLGGFVAARIAKKAEVKNAFFVGLASLIFGLIFIAVNFAAAGFWWPDLLFLLLTIPSAMLGGYIYRQDRARHIKEKGL